MIELKHLDGKLLRERCSRPFCHGNLELRWDRDVTDEHRLVKHCWLCGRETELDGSEIKGFKGDGKGTAWSKSYRR